MKKIRVFLIGAMVLFWAFGVALAAEGERNIQVVQTFDLYLNGVHVPPASTLKIAPGETIILEVRKVGMQTITVSGDDYPVVELTNNSSTLTGSGTVHMFYNTSLSELNITAANVVDGTAQIQLEINVQGGDGTVFKGPYYTQTYPLRLRTQETPELNYLFVPKSIRLTDTNYKPVDNIRIEASKTRLLYAVAEDYNKNGVLDKDDYDVIPVNNLVMRPSVETDADDTATGTSSMPTLTGKTPTMAVYPRRIADVTIKGLNEGGDADSDYLIKYTEVFYQIEFGGTTGSGVDVKDIIPNDGKIETPRLSVAVTPLDDGGNGSDSGGSCNALGLGMLLLAVPALSVLGKAKR